MEMKSNENKEAKEEAQAQVEIWKYVLGFTPMAIVKCAIELQIADVLESHGGTITLHALSTAVGCPPPILHRIMRYLMHHGIFKKKPGCIPVCYVQTPLSRLLLKNGVGSMVPLIMLETSPVMLGPWHNLSQRTFSNCTSAFEASNGEDLWKYTAANPDHSKLINDAMASHAITAMSAIIDQYPDAFEGITSVVDVGGGDGTALRTLVKACPWIHGINFDLPHVVRTGSRCDGVELVEGDMFQKVPKADVAFLMWVLHDWSDDECICILRNCREAIPKDTGKVIIAEAVIEEGEEEEDEYGDIRLALDMVMLAHTEKGKERTYEEWKLVLSAAGFTRFTVKRIEAVVAVIEAFP